MSDSLSKSDETYQTLLALKNEPFSQLDPHDVHNNRNWQIKFTEFYTQWRQEQHHMHGWDRYMRNSIEHIGLSFRYPATAWHIPYKLGLVGLGAWMAPQGVYNAIQGSLEETPKTAGSSGGANMTRIFVGGFEAIAGAALLYFGLTKGGHLGKMGHDLMRRGEGLMR